MTIHYLTPYSVEKNIGKAYNEACALIPDGDWICIRDGDTMFLTDHWGSQIEDIVSNNQEYSLIGCLTNRLRASHQLYHGEFSANSDVLHHQAIAERLHQDHYSEVIETQKGVAGMFMLFPKKIWQRVQFRENSAAFDAFFCREIKKKGEMIGVAQGLYVFHKYRLGKENPKQNNQHLLI